MPQDNSIADIYISYAGNNPEDGFAGSRDDIVKNICEQLSNHQLHAREYKRDIGYKDSIGNFMDDIADADYIILLISDKYLRSEYCMYEATELLAKNKKNLLTKIFPILLPDAKIRDNEAQVEYIKYWIEKHEKHKKLIEGLPPEYIIGLTQIGIRYREIKENINTLITQIMDVAQLSKALIKAHDYKMVIDSILKRIELKNKGNVSAQLMPVSVPGQSAPSIYQQLTDTGNGNVTELAQGVNNFLSTVFNKFDDKIFDSEKAKKEFLDVNFDDISSAGTMSPLSRDIVAKIRADSEKFESYRRSLIISALSLGLIKKYDDEKARMLIDFISDGEPGLWHRALVGLIMGLLGKEDYVSDEIERKLKKLQKDDDVQDCFVMIFFYIGNIDELEKISTSLKSIDYNKFEFFNQTQHWFLPFYEGNLILKENIPNKKFAQALQQATVLFGLDNTKYAMALLYPSLDDEALGRLNEFFEVDMAMISSLQSEESKKSFLTQTEVLKYLLEFYVFAIYKDKPEIIDLVEDKKMYKKGKIFELVTHPHYKARLLANELIKEKNYEEAANVLKPVLEDDPGNKQVLFMSALSNYMAGKIEESIPLFEKSIEKGFKEGIIYAHVGDAYFNTKNYEKAIENYKILLTMQDNIPALLNIGRSYQLQEKPEPEKALPFFKKVEEKDPENYINLLSLGDYYYNCKPKDVTNSYNYYLRAFEVNPDTLGLVQALDELVLDPGNENKNVEKQISIYKKYAELDPQNIRPLILLGACYQDVIPPDFAASFEAYKKAYDINPENAITNQYLGEVYLKIENPDYEKALQYLLVTIKKEPENKTAVFYAGWASFVLGKYADAEIHFTACLDSEHANIANQNLGHIALVNNNVPKAKEFYKTAYNLFENKNEFKETSLSDMPYLEKGGVDKNKFENLIQEIMKNN